MTFDTKFDSVPNFSPEQAEALLKGEAVHINGVRFTVANFRDPEVKTYGPPAAPHVDTFEVYRADPETWKRAAAAVAPKVGKTAAELEKMLGYDLLDKLISLLK